MELKQKITSFNVAGIAVFAVILGVLTFLTLSRTFDGMLSDFHGSLMAEKEQYIRNQVEVAASAIRESARPENGGSPEKAAELAAALRHADGSGYFFAYEPDGEGGWRFAFHGTKRALWGKKANLDKPDVNGFAFRRALIDAGKAGGGLVSYHYEKPTTQEILGKLAYAKHVPELDWVVCSGIYVDDIEATLGVVDGQVTEARKSLFVGRMIATVALFLVMGVVSWWLARRIAGPLAEAVTVADAVALGDLSHRLNSVDRRDETGALARALNRMTDVLQEKADEAKQIADGDLTVQVQVGGPQDTFGHALKRMAEQLATAIAGVRSVADRVGTGASEISDGSTGLSQGTTEQAASLQEISASMTELAGQVSVNAGHAEQADRLTDEAATVGGEGVDRMRQMTEAMNEISSSSEEISKIIKVIDDIAFQTNLLALNAAVEAARAGQHGKGFAVVAEEVRNLAGRSAKAARETSELIEGSLDKVNAGSSIAGETSGALERIVESVDKASELVRGIARASKEQADGIGEVTGGLSQIDTVTQQNAANSEEIASASVELREQAGTLQQLLARFRIQDAQPTARRVEKVAAARKPVQESAARDMRESEGELVASLEDGW